MNKLLNRFAWVLSLVFWYIIAFIFIWWSVNILSYNEILLSGLLWIVIWFIVKGVIFPYNFIEKSIKKLINSSKEVYISNKKLSKKNVEKKSKNLSILKENILEDNNSLENNILKKEITLVDEIENIDVSNIKVVRLFPNKSEKFTIRAKNIIKLLILAKNKMNKNNFEWKELSWIYKTIIKKYKEKFSRREYDKIRTSVKNFIDEWWEIEIVKK